MHEILNMCKAADILVADEQNHFFTQKRMDLVLT